MSIAQAEQLLEQKCFVQAEELYLKLQESDTQLFRCYLGLSKVRAYQRNFLSALSMIDSAIELSPHSFEALLQRVFLLLELEDYEQAKEILCICFAQKFESQVYLAILLECELRKDSSLPKTVFWTVQSARNFSELESDSFKAQAIENIDSVFISLFNQSLFDVYLNIIKKISKFKHSDVSNQAFSIALQIWWDRYLSGYGCSGRLNLDSALIKKPIENPILSNTIKVIYRRELLRRGLLIGDLSLVETLLEKNQLEASKLSLSEVHSRVALAYRNELDDSAFEQIQNCSLNYPDNLFFQAKLAEIYYFAEKNLAKTIAFCLTTLDSCCFDRHSNSELLSILILSLCRLGRFSEAEYYLDRLVRQKSERGFSNVITYEFERLNGNSFAAVEALNSLYRYHDIETIFRPDQNKPLSVLNIAAASKGLAQSANQTQVTVVFTTHRMNKFLAISLNSILQQTHKNLEVLVIIDGVNDELKFRVESIVEGDKRVKIICQEKSMGVYFARNLALSLASSEFISFMDDDDWAHPRSVELRIDRLKSSKAIAVTTSCLRLELSGKIELKPERPLRQAEISVMIKREVLETIGFFQSVRSGGDSEYLARIKTVWGFDAIATIEAPLLIMARHENSLTGSDYKNNWNRPSNYLQNYIVEYSKFHRNIRGRRVSAFWPKCVS